MYGVAKGSVLVTSRNHAWVDSSTLPAPNQEEYQELSFLNWQPESVANGVGGSLTRYHAFLFGKYDA
jgi:hypothetical protein